jgi:spore coat protein A
VLFEGLDEYGRLQPLLGTLQQGSLAWFEPITESPTLNDVEVWEVYNATEDAHPIHLHLVAFQIMERESFEGEVIDKPQPQHDGSFGVGGVLTVEELGGDARGPEPNEAGWKDTAVMFPGEVTRVIAKFDRAGRYVWHCHILSHEDHEMMRPYEVLAPNAPRTLTSAREDQLRLSAMGTELAIDLQRAADVEVRIFDVLGREVRGLEPFLLPAGERRVQWDGRDNGGRAVPAGVYFYQVRAAEAVETAKAVIIR